MKELEYDITKLFYGGLRRFKNQEGLIACFGVEEEDGEYLEPPSLVELNTSYAWPTDGIEECSGTRDIVIVVKDYVSDADVSGAHVWIDGVDEGTADANGELAISDIAIGGHSIKITATGYTDSDQDSLLNDYFVVT